MDVVVLICTGDDTSDHVLGVYTSKEKAEAAWNVWSAANTSIVKHFNSKPFYNTIEVDAHAA
jgi:hypothetical protein